MKQVISLLTTLMFLLVSFSACTSTDEALPVTDWDLRAIGYYENWDKELSDKGYKIGIVDIASKAISDDGCTEVTHTDLLKAIVTRLTAICEVEVIELSEENNTTDELIRAIEMLIDRGHKVINVSLGTSEAFEFSDELNEKIINNDVFVICSAGNTSVGLMYPALCKNTYSVLPCDIYKRTNKNLEGVEKCSYTMPGLHVQLFDNYFSGSSISAVYFSVICAAFCAAHPNLERDAIINNIQNSCVLNDGNSYGIIQIDSLFKN